MSKIGIVIEREYMERVKRKFIITTLLDAVDASADGHVYADWRAMSTSSAATVAVIDNTRVILPEREVPEDLEILSGRSMPR